MDERIAQVRAEIEAAEAREHAAAMDKHRAEAELAALEGREWDREYHEAFVAAQTHQPGGDERFWAHVRRRDAQRVIAGQAVLTDFAPYERAGIAAEVARLQSEQQQPSPAAAVTATTNQPGGTQ